MRKKRVSVALLALVFCGGMAAAQPGEPPSRGKLPGTTGWTDEGQQTNYDVFLKPAGAVRAVMLFVDFANHRADAAPDGFRQTQRYYDFLVPGAVQWYKDSSYNALKLDVTPVHKWYHMSRPDDAYDFARGLTWEKHVAYVEEALSLADGDVDFSQYSLFYIVPVRSASQITFSPTYIDDSPFWGWPAWVVKDGVNIRWGVTTGQDAWLSWGSKILNHETSHTFGLPDLYAFVPQWIWMGTSYYSDYHYFVGGWDLMGLISGQAPDLLAWHKWKLGWVADNQVDVVTKAGTTEHHLTPVERNGSNKLLVVRTGETTAYGVELRLRLVTDASAVDTGVLIYRIDSSTWSGYGPIEVMDASPGGTAIPARSLDAACFGVGPNRVSTFTDAASGVTITVTKQAGENAFVRVEKASDTVFE